MKNKFLRSSGWFIIGASFLLLTGDFDERRGFPQLEADDDVFPKGYTGE